MLSAQAGLAGVSHLRLVQDPPINHRFLNTKKLEMWKSTHSLYLVNTLLQIFTGISGSYFHPLFLFLLEKSGLWPILIFCFSIHT